MSQRLILTGERSGLQTRIAATESALLCGRRIRFLRAPYVLSAVRVSSLFQVLHGFRVADSVDRIISIISLSL